VTEINIMIQNLTNDRHRLEGDLTMMRQQLDDAVTARRSAEERAERLGVEVRTMCVQEMFKQNNANQDWLLYGLVRRATGLPGGFSGSPRYSPCVAYTR